MSRGARSRSGFAKLRMMILLGRRRLAWCRKAGPRAGASAAKHHPLHRETGASLLLSVPVAAPLPTRRPFNLASSGPCHIPTFPSPSLSTRLLTLLPRPPQHLKLCPPLLPNPMAYPCPRSNASATLADDAMPLLGRHLLDTPAHSSISVPSM